MGIAGRRRAVVGLSILGILANIGFVESTREKQIVYIKKYDFSTKYTEASSDRFYFIGDKVVFSDGKDLIVTNRFTGEEVKKIAGIKYPVLVNRGRLYYLSIDGIYSLDINNSKMKLVFNLKNIDTYKDFVYNFKAVGDIFIITYVEKYEYYTYGISLDRKTVIWKNIGDGKLSSPPMYIYGVNEKYFTSNLSTNGFDFYQTKTGKYIDNARGLYPPQETGENDRLPTECMKDFVNRVIDCRYGGYIVKYGIKEDNYKTLLTIIRSRK